MKQNLLFVDDEPNILKGLRRSTRNMQNEWSMDFAEGAREALEKMQGTEYKAIVSDLRMPDIDGAEFLNSARKLQPNSIRMILSGHSDMDMAARSATSAHRFLSKPCSSEDLKANLTAALELRSNYDCAVMLRIATASKPLPAAPKLYQSLTLLLSDENSKIEDVAYLMANDVSMSSSILKIANSSFFNISSSIDNIEKAVIVLGIDVIRNLVLVNEIINCYDSGSFKWLDIEKLWQQSFLSADIARKISSSCSSQKHILDQTYTAGIMQNIGIVVLAESLGKEYQEVYESSLVQTQLGEDRMIDFTELARLEVERFGFTHHQLAAYMLKLWDLSDSIIEGVCFSHSYICDNGSLPQKFLFISNEILAYHLLATPISSEVLEQINALGQTIENVVVLSKKRLNQ